MRPIRDLLTVFGRSYQDQLARLDDEACRYFSSVVHLAGSARIKHPVYLKNPQYMQVGAGFSSGPGLRIEAWDSYRGTRYTPVLEVGNNVSLNFNCHIGLIARIAIGDNALIGSNVLITDHHHGDPRNLLPGKTFKHQPLFTPGSVEIGENVWIGENACIFGGVTIGPNSIVGANSVVNRDVPACSAVAGVPARVIRRLSL